MTPTTPNALRIAALFNRRHTTPWSDREIRQYKNLYRKGCFKPEELELIERYYVYQRRRQDGSNLATGIHRRDLATFLNNYPGELDRARAWDEEQRERHKRAVGKRWAGCNVEVTGEKPATDEDFKTAGILAKKMVADLKAKMGRI